MQSYLWVYKYTCYYNMDGTLLMNRVEEYTFRLIEKAAIVFSVLVVKFDM